MVLEGGGGHLVERVQRNLGTCVVSFVSCATSIIQLFCLKDFTAKLNLYENTEIIFLYYIVES